MTNHNGYAGKMSEEFYLPLTNKHGVVEDDNGLFVADLSSNEMDRAMCHAINSHDALLEQVEFMKEALTSISDMCIGEIAMNHNLDAQYIGELIYEATGMTNPELHEDLKGVD